MKDLAVNGRDLINASVPEGAKVGAILNKLLDMVIDEEVENEKSAMRACFDKQKEAWLLE